MNQREECDSGSQERNKRKSDAGHVVGTKEDPRPEFKQAGETSNRNQVASDPGVNEDTGQASETKTGASPMNKKCV